MKKMLETLWNEYLAEKCAPLNTQEKELAEKALKNHGIAKELLTEEQNDAVEKYIDNLCEMQSSALKKAFIAGCEFATAFFLEAGHLEGR